MSELEIFKKNLAKRLKEAARWADDGDSMGTTSDVATAKISIFSSLAELVENTPHTEEVEE